jgi:hypothetical protein
VDTLLSTSETIDQQTQQRAVQQPVDATPAEGREKAQRRFLTAGLRAS